MPSLSTNGENAPAATDATAAADAPVSDLRFADGLPEVVARFDKHLRHTFVNKVIERITGISPEQYLGKTNGDLGMTPALVGKWNAAIETVFQTGKPIDVQFSFQSLDGLREFTSTMTPELGAQGEVLSVVCLARDTTEIKRMRAQVLEQDTYRQQVDRHYSTEFNRLLNITAGATLGAPIATLNPEAAPTGDVLLQLGSEVIESHFRAIVESSDDAIISKTLDGKVSSWNAGATRMFGYTEAEMLGKPMRQIFPKERRDEETFILERIAEGERVEHFETVRLHKDGHKVDVSVSISPIRNRAGVIVGASKIARDITALRREQQRLQMTLEATTDGLWDWDLRSGAVFRTANYYTLIGIAEEEDTHDFEFFKQTIHPEDLQNVLANIQAHLKGHTSKVEFEYRLMVRAVATGRWLQVRARVVERDANGNAVRLLGTLSDITARKVAEIAAQQRAIQMQRLLEGATEAFWERDLLTGKIEVSARWERMLGYEPGELGHPTLETLLAMIHPDDADRARRAMDQHLSGATADYSVQLRCRNKAGDWIWVLSRGRAVEWGPDGKPTKLAGTRTDITEEKRLQDLLKGAPEA